MLFSEAFGAGTPRDNGAPIGLKWYQSNQFSPPDAHDDQLLAYGSERIPEIDRTSPVDCTFYCGCPTTSNCSVEEIDPNRLKTRITNVPLGIKTCDAINLSYRVPKESYGCTHLQRQSILRCGCPYESPTSPKCNLCANGSSVPESAFEIVPFENETGKIVYIDKLTCKELQWQVASFDSAECLSYQAFHGPRCGCSSDTKPRCIEHEVCTDGAFNGTHVLDEFFFAHEDYSGDSCASILRDFNRYNGCEFVMDDLARVCCFRDYE